MNKREVFLEIFDSGIDYDSYFAKSERHVERMEKSAIETLRLLESKDLDALNVPLKVLVISEYFCGDCGNGTPVIAKLAEKVPSWEFRIASRNQFEDKLKLFYTTAGRLKIPIIIFADEDGDEITHWIERPRNSYIALADIQARRLPKEEYIKVYKSNPEINVPGVCKFILDELYDRASKASALVKILPKKQKLTN